jgi:hypothetical protein
LTAPFPYFGGKRKIAALIWERLGTPKHYIEPFCGSAAILLAAPRLASLEVIGDANGFIANFWRATVHQPERVAHWADYPVSHVDLGARHVWLLARRAELEAGLRDADWPGDAKAAGWWLWGQCCWIGEGWCDWQRRKPLVGMGQVPHISNAGQGIQAMGQVPHISDAGRGVQAMGQVPRIGDGTDQYWTSGGRAAGVMLRSLADRMGRVRVVHGAWDRCLNHNYGGDNTAIVLDPPYRGYEKLYGSGAPVVDAVETWAREHAHLRVALCGMAGDYDLPGWDIVPWSRGKATYGGKGTTDSERVWFSPACIAPTIRQQDLFSA